MQRKCCAHCPGDVTRTGEPAREHACDVPGYVAGSLTTQQEGSCFERFATARKCHSDNLQHQPIFTEGLEQMQNDACRCEEDVKRLIDVECRSRELSRVHRYAPALGCKEPTTYMDLAICWETPTDPLYEPRKAVHVDGSDGGPAPAVFTLVQHEPSQVDLRDGCIPGRSGRDRQRCGDECAHVRKADAEMEGDELCRHLDSVSLSPAGGKKVVARPPVGAAARKKRAEFLRHCATNVGHELPKKTCKVRSASCLQKRGCTVVRAKNNGLVPTLDAGGRALQVPRPRTPYARRAFCIDTLAPPFSVVNGCRDADFPEHWRLTSVYQQSYRNPRKMREGRTLIHYDRSFV
ncbi:uncharacterized protein LOC106646763 [Copidosoma floridanum]|uniref:uncharacterized protein LOC106646763 n=1 Tax=Copidosoma floridanum TaxID=29053 RepID=UPI000C6F9933|nr:uncharacterized protein LOC106646763 [Copidosoma floridanum]